MAFTRLNRNFLVLGLSLLGCSPSQPSAETAVTLGSSSSESGDEPIDMGMPPATCSSEWDCGLGERCVDGECVCVGCACPQNAPAQPDTIEQPDIVETIPVEFGGGPEPECGDDLDCGPLEFCDGWSCVETTECVEDIDCWEDWPEEHRFCIDGLCKTLDCVDDLDCPEVALCYGDCKWIEPLPDCVDIPSFELGAVGMLLTPDSAGVVILDLDLDGRDDLAVLDDDAVHWLMSTGAGFEAPLPWAGDPGMQPVGLGRADIHGDGVDELLVGYAGVLGVEILEVGEAGPQLVSFVTTLEVPHVPTTMDLDYDGLPDLVSGSAFDGPTTSIEARLGDGTGTFEALWTNDVEPFDWIGPFPPFDETTTCDRALATSEYEVIGIRQLDHEKVGGGVGQVFGQLTVGQMIFDETPAHPAGIVATMPHGDRGALYLYQSESPKPYELVEISAEPDDVVLVSPDGQTHWAIVDRGANPADFVQFTGNPLAPVCRGSLGFALDAEELGVGDFDGDGRDDVLERRSDGSLNAWYSRE